MRVLLADDHAIVRRGLRGLLEEGGHSVLAEASDGLEAVRLCEEHLPDLSRDFAMPKLNGIDKNATDEDLLPAVRAVAAGRSRRTAPISCKSSTCTTPPTSCCTRSGKA